MSDRIRWLNAWVNADCALANPPCSYAERIEEPTPDQQKAFVRRARQHALRTGHYVSIERGQTARVAA